ncbi:hydroxysqualene dehydroxylase HpnE [Streptomyces sp. DSM 44917]|uniref:Hydroxysqualene dehydroxylase HpnE n=1 Tax=Streptomyces boetiae TaxID=3075541 RepID=A0ABU2L4S6_9ACTN|nr:hydroxysqualene dehydroxylase HpnE [Streptomyces sp. DSM 44917]MDT0306565.1 hydroxysqualene dehydroxylase HpnE [Streptomyces sp. DSM 44917]
MTATAPAAPRRARPRAVVAGGGLAGITAALALADRGHAVTLVEGRPRLGGLAFSFRRDSPAGPLTVDNGQHVYLRCCTAYRGFLHRIGGADLAPLQPRLDVPVLDAARGRQARIRRTELPVPLHLAASMARYPHLTPGERAAAARATLALRGLDPADPALDERDFAGWLRERGQSPRAVEALWDLIGVATLNARAQDVSLGLAAMVFRTGLLTGRGAADIGVPRVPLGELHDTLARAALEKAGVTVLLGTRVRRLRREHGGTWRVVLAGRAPGGTDDAPEDFPVDGSPREGEHGRPGREARELSAERVVLAVPHDAAHGLLPAGALEDAGRLLRIGTSPILNVHVVYDRPVLREPFLAALGTPIQWVFDRTGPAGLPGPPGRYVALSQSAAGEEIQQPADVLRKRYLPELARLLPEAADARVVDFFVTRERAATFAPAPGVGRLRPGPVTRAPGLFLAGAWTATGWPATMEGAVRSGLAAARAAAGGAPSDPPDQAREAAGRR